MRSPLRLLVIDDGPEPHEVLDLLFGAAQVTHAYDGQQGLQLLATRPGFDVVILDLAMPTVDGFTVLETLKNDRRLPDVPVCVFTGSREEAIRALSLGARDFIDKRSDYQELKLRVLNLVEARRRAEAARQAKTDFLAMVSHELRTPMNGIIGMAEALRDGGLSAEQSRYLEALEQSTRRLTALVDDVLDFLGSEDPVSNLPRRAFQPRQLVNSVLESLADHALRNETILDAHWAEGVAESLHGLPDKIALVLRHLVANAVKFAPGGKVLVQVEPRGTEGLVFTVKDTGIGFPEGWQERISEPFVQGDGSETRRFGGLGLGLSIANRVAHLLGGSLVVESEPGRGSAVRFTC